MTACENRSTIRVPVPDAPAMRRLGSRFAASCDPGDVVSLTGPIGAGKTTFVQGMGRGLGVAGPITSPTFVIARIHPSHADGPSLIHVDAYRLNGFPEFDDLDLELDIDNSVIVVEWGGGMVETLARPLLSVAIARSVDLSDGSRMVTISMPGNHEPLAE